MGEVVVTGAAGFVGRHLVERLAAEGRGVVGIDRSPAVPPAARRLVADVAEPDERVTAALQNAEAVFHLAGCPGVRTSRPDIRQRRHHDNVLAGHRVLSATPSGVPVVVASSSSVYGGTSPAATGAPRPSRETDPVAPLGGYARSKARLEEACAERRAAGGATAVARLFTVAGAAQRPDMAIARWLHAAHAGRVVEVYGSLQRRRDITDVRAVVEGLVRILERGAMTTLNLGTGRAHPLADVVEAVAAATGRDLSVAVHPAGAQEPAVTCADTRRCARWLGWTPATDLPALVRWQAEAAGVAAVAATT